MSEYDPAQSGDEPPVWRRVRFVVWSVIVVVFGLFVAAGSVPVRTASEQVEWVRVARIWSIQANNLTERQQYDGVVSAAFWGVLMVFSIGSAVALWLTLAGPAARSANPEHPDPSANVIDEPS